MNFHVNFNMFIDLKNKFIYVRPPKTASTSLMNYFQNLQQDEMTFRFKSLNISQNAIYMNNRGPNGKEIKELVYNRHPSNNLHPLPSEISNLFINKEDFYSFKSIISVRNPYYHAISYYRFQKEQFNRRYKDKSHIKFFKNHPLRFFGQLFFSSHSKNNFYLFLKYFYKPYTNWLNIEGRCYGDYFIRSEFIDKDLMIVKKELSLDDAELNILNSNQNSRKVNLDDFFNARTKSFIEEEYHDVIKKFKYEYK